MCIYVGISALYNSDAVIYALGVVLGDHALCITWFI